MTSTTNDLPHGTELSGYRIERTLGQGSFGITYLVTDTQLGLRLALKEYFPREVAVRTTEGVVVPRAGQEQAFRSGLASFLQEGRVLAQLSHPNVVRVQRYFEAQGTAWLAMAWLDGEPLDRLLALGGTFSSEEIQHLIGPLLGALEHVHEHGIIHGDIKPANICLTRQGQPVLLDFGSARGAAERRASPSFGSDGYAAPEQFSGDMVSGPWTDIYGLSATLYRLATGRKPVSARQRLRARAAGSPDPLEPISGISGMGLPAAIQAGIDAGLQLDADRRPRSVAAWRAAWDAGLRESRAVPKTRPEPAATNAAPVRRLSPPRLLLGAFILAFTAMVLFLLLDPGSRPGPDTDPGPASTLPTRASEAEAWDQAVRSDNVAAYRTYIEAFPQGPNVENAQAQLRTLDDEAWAAATASGSLQGFQDYLENFPDGAQLVAARARIAELQAQAEQEQRARQAAAAADQVAWNKARNARTLAAVDQYQQQFPNGSYHGEAQQLRAEILRAGSDDAAFAAALGINRVSAYRDYLSAFPKGRHVAEAMAALERLAPGPGKVFRDCVECPAMVVLPAGSFEQGAAREDSVALTNEKPAHTVQFSRPFAISVHEITFAEWEQCRVAGGCKANPADNGWGRGQRPVIWVSWEEARAYAAWLSSRTGETYELPSESQWEYAARAGQSGHWAGGDAAALCQSGNVAGTETAFDWRHTACSDPFSFGTAPVGQFRANAFGIHDMIGNVAEWTRDCMNISYIDAPADGSAWERGLCNSRVTRGGSWFSGSAQARLSARFTLRGGDRNDFTGIRVVRTIRE